MYVDEGQKRYRAALERMIETYCEHFLPKELKDSPYASLELLYFLLDKSLDEKGKANMSLEMEVGNLRGGPNRFLCADGKYCDLMWSYINRAGAVWPVPQKGFVDIYCAAAYAIVRVTTRSQITDYYAEMLKDVFNKAAK